VDAALDRFASESDRAQAAKEGEQSAGDRRARAQQEKDTTSQ